MELAAAVRPGRAWPHRFRTVRLRLEAARLGAGRVEVALVDPATEAVEELPLETRAYDSLTGMVRALQWCDRTFACDSETVLSAWDRELESECAVCLGAVRVHDHEVARCARCPSRFHRECARAACASGDCPVCRRPMACHGWGEDRAAEK